MKPTLFSCFRTGGLNVVLSIGLLFLALVSPALSAGETVTYFHNDASGTPLVATDAQGNVVWKQEYRPYGDALHDTSTAPANSIGFAGYPFDAATGLAYLGGRYYSPTLGRFISIDPKEVDPNDLYSFNRYAYANNNPYKYIDPDGQNPVLIGLAIWVALEVLLPTPEPPAHAPDAIYPTTFPFDPTIAAKGAGLTIAAIGAIKRQGVKEAAKTAVTKGMTNSASVVFDVKQLQAKFKHASDFGVSGSWSKSAASQFENALKAHIDSPTTQVIQGAYRGNPVIHFFDPKTGLNVMKDSIGNFVSGWKLTPEQIRYVTTTGKLGGG